MGRRKGQNSECILISKSDEHHPAAYILQIIQFYHFSFAKSDKDPIEKVCCDYSLHMAVTHWGPEVEAEMAKVVSPEVKQKFSLVWILAFVNNSIFLQDWHQLVQSVHGLQGCLHVEVSINLDQPFVNSNLFGFALLVKT